MRHGLLTTIMLSLLLGCPMASLPPMRVLPAESATYYVGKSGSDSNSCGNAQNATDQTKRKLTINGGISCLASGDTLVVGTGTYAESIGHVAGDYPYCNANDPCADVRVPNGLSPSQPTVLRSEIPRLGPGRTPQSGAAVIKANRLTGFSPPPGGFYGMIFPMSWQNGVLDGFVSDSGNQVVYGQDVEIRERAGQGSPGNVTIKNMEITRSGSHTAQGDCSVGMTMSFTSSGYLIQNNWIHDLGGAVNDGCYCMYLHASNMTIEDNECSGSTFYGIQYYNTCTPGSSDEHCATFVENSHNIIRRNYIHDTCGAGMTLAAWGVNNQVYNNVLNNTNRPACAGFTHSQYGIEFMCYGAYQPGTWHLYNNTIVGYGQTAVADCGNTSHIKNNLFYNNGSNSVCTACAPGTIANATNWDHQANLAAAASWFDVGAGDSWTLAPAATAAIDHGANLSSFFTTDYVGATRTAPFDVGAYEYGAPVVVIDSELAHWAYDEASGTTTEDLTVSGHTVTFTGGATRGPGLIGAHSIQFDGSTQYGTMTGNPGFLGNPPVITVQTWFKVDSFGTDGFAELISLGDNVVLKLLSATTLRAFYASGGTSPLLDVTPPRPPLGTGWHFVAYANNPGAGGGGRQTLFYDGQVLATGTSGLSMTYNAGGTDTQLGRHGKTVKNLWAGALDDTHVYNYERTLAQMQADYAAGLTVRHRHGGGGLR